MFKCAVMTISLYADQCTFGSTSVKEVGEVDLRKLKLVTVLSAGLRKAGWAHRLSRVGIPSMLYLILYVKHRIEWYVGM